ncbi:MAG: hypothetical protein ABIB47_01005 [Candidatus Woesearchaeota archaeon]
MDQLKRHPWRNIAFGLVLIYLGWKMGGFFKVNYVIGIGGILLGLWELWRKKK